MAAVASRDLRNHTREVLDRVAGGETVQITVHGEVVAEISPVRRRKPRHGDAKELFEFLARRGPDPELYALLNDDAETTDDLDDPWEDR